MRPSKKPASRSPAQQKTPEQSKQSKPPTWPRLDLDPPEHMLGQLSSWGRVALSSGYLNAADYAVVEEAVQRLRLAEAEVLALLGPVNALASAPRLRELIAGVAGAAYVIGAHGAMPDTARVFFERSRATHMRLCRATSEKEQELQTAIKAAVDASNGKIPSGKPYKDADSIIDLVNARVREPVKVDAIARRIAALYKNAEKWPHSSRTRKK